jgi:alpha-L-fucosidase
MLSIPLRGDGTIDEDESKFIDDLTSWMQPNGEAIFATRPFSVYGEGTPDVRGTANFNESRSRAYTPKDIRFTTKGSVLYATALAWPEDGKLTIETLAQSRPEYPRQIGRVELLGSPGPLKFTREAGGLVVTLPANKPNDFAYVLKIQPA